VELAQNAPLVLNFLTDKANEHFDELKKLLDRYGTCYRVVPSMVRGLDYYTSTIFEIQADTVALGAQKAIVGGGRYDDLVEQLGGCSTPAIGFSFGIERLITIMGENTRTCRSALYYVAGVGHGGFERARDLARELRGKGYKTDVAYAEGSLKSQLKRADRLGATLTIITGEDEAARGAVTLRDMKSGNQQEIPLNELATRIEAFK
jgi:histidyl-tRNA synthetase